MKQDDTVSITLPRDVANSLTKLDRLFENRSKPFLGPHCDICGRGLARKRGGKGGGTRFVHQLSCPIGIICRSARWAIDTANALAAEIQPEPTPVPDEDHGYYCGPAIPSGCRPPRASPEASEADYASDLLRRDQHDLRRELEALRQAHHELRETFEASCKRTDDQLAVLQRHVNRLRAVSEPIG